MAWLRALGSEFEKVLTTRMWWLLAILLVAYVAFLAGGFGAFLGWTIENPDAAAAAGGNTNLPPGLDLAPLVYSFASSIGYGRWAENGDGSVVGGSMFLDSRFDKNDDRRRLLRIHELGHALGQLHVETRPSIMNPSIGPEPTEFDRQAAVVAFQRPPGNVSPDADPGTTVKSGVWSVRWVAPVRCTLR